MSENYFILFFILFPFNISLKKLLESQSLKALAQQKKQVRRSLVNGNNIHNF